MPKKRNCKIVVHMESNVFNAAKRVIEAEDTSDSAYVRQAVIKDLVSRGLLTEEMVLELAMN